MSAEQQPGIKETLTPQEEAYEYLNNLVRKGPCEISPGFVLRKRVEEDENNVPIREFIVATNTSRQDGIFVESTHTFDNLGLHSESHLETRPSLIQGLPTITLTCERKRNDYTSDEQKRYAARIVPFAADVRRRLDGQSEAVQIDGGNHQKPDNITPFPDPEPTVA